MVCSSVPLFSSCYADCPFVFRLLAACLLREVCQTLTKSGLGFASPLLFFNGLLRVLLRFCLVVMATGAASRLDLPRLKINP